MPDSASKPPWALASTIAAVVVGLDQATKAWALGALRGEPPLTVIPGLFDLTFGMNTGGVFGILAGEPSAARRLLFAAATAAALAMVATLLARWGRESRRLAAALSLVAGGAIGNLVDRLRFGSVVDFIDWHWRGHHWPTFNVADSAITVGSALLLWHAFAPGRPRSGPGPEPAGGG